MGTKTTSNEGMRAALIDFAAAAGAWGRWDMSIKQRLRLLQKHAAVLDTFKDEIIAAASRTSDMTDRVSPEEQEDPEGKQ